ncbi:MAG: hypothetical protein ACRBF0_22040 [Calditrichia bacterium]
MLDTYTIYEIIGYVASAMVAVSLMMSSILKLRIFNMIGAIIFVVYGLLIKAYPVALMNLFIVGINIYHLSHLFHSDTTKTFSILDVEDESPYLRYVLERFNEDIAGHFPNFELRPEREQIAFMVMIGLNPVGVFIGEKTDAQSLDIQLDYVIPEYRDYKVGRFIYHDHRSYFTAQGIKKLYMNVNGNGQRFYLNKMNFSETNETNRFMLSLT